MNLTDVEYINECRQFNSNIRGILVDLKDEKVSHEEAAEAILGAAINRIISMQRTPPGEYHVTINGQEKGVRI